MANSVIEREKRCERGGSALEKDRYIECRLDLELAGLTSYSMHGRSYRR